MYCTELKPSMMNDINISYSITTVEYVSSAKITYLKIGEAYVISLIKNTNNCGHKTHPWGTPYVIDWHSENVSFICTYSLRYRKYDEIKLYTIPRSSCNFSRKCIERFLRTVSVKKYKTLDVGIFLLKQYWTDDNMSQKIWLTASHESVNYWTGL